MKIIILRHAIAEDRDAWADKSEDDSLRPLTERGISRLHQACLGLKTVVDRVDAIVSSSLTRAQQTAQILFEYYPDAELGEDPDLEPGGDLDSLVDRLADSSDSAVIVLIGHEPDLSTLLGLLIAGAERSIAKLKKASAVCVDFSVENGDFYARLLWLLPPAVLRSLGREREGVVQNAVD